MKGAGLNDSFLFEYKGYFGSAEIDFDEKYLFGRLLFMSDVIAYSARTVYGLHAAFEEAVDDYISALENKKG